MTLYQRWCLYKAGIKIKLLNDIYTQPTKLLDIGSGNGALCRLLQRQGGHEITPLDIKNKSVFTDIIPVIANATELPFEDESFDVVQLITVLHHTQKPENIIAEAARVGKKLVVMEDIYTHTLQKYLTWMADSINNWEFAGHPHTNKTDPEWRRIFHKYRLEVEAARYTHLFGIFTQVIYVLKKRSS